MNREDVVAKLNLVFKDVFDDESLSIDDKTTASDIEDWDSLTHITLLSEVEDAFSIKFTMKEVIGLKNVGEMIDLILNKINK